MALGPDIAVCAPPKPPCRSAVPLGRPPASEEKLEAIKEEAVQQNKLNNFYLNKRSKNSTKNSNFSRKKSSKNSTVTEQKSLDTKQSECEEWRKDTIQLLANVRNEVILPDEIIFKEFEDGDSTHPRPKYVYMHSISLSHSALSLPLSISLHLLSPCPQ